MQDDAIETTDNRVTLVAKLMNTLMNTRTQIKILTCNWTDFFITLKFLFIFFLLLLLKKSDFFIQWKIQIIVLILDGNSGHVAHIGFFLEKNQIFYCSRSKQRPYANQITVSLRTRQAIFLTLILKGGFLPFDFIGG